MEQRPKLCNYERGHVVEGKEKSSKGVVSAGEGPFAAANGPRRRCLRLAQDDLSSPYQLFFYTHHHAAFLYLITVLSQYQQSINRRQPILFRDLPVGQDIPARSVIPFGELRRT